MNAFLINISNQYLFYLIFQYKEMTMKIRTSKATSHTRGKKKDLDSKLKNKDKNKTSSVDELIHYLDNNDEVKRF